MKSANGRIFWERLPAGARPTLVHPAYFQLWIRHAIQLGRNGINLDLLVASAELLCNAAQRKNVAKEYAAIGDTWFRTYNATPSITDFLAVLLQMAEMKAFTIDGNQCVKLVDGQEIHDGAWVKLDAYLTLRAASMRPSSTTTFSGETKPTIDKVIQLAPVAA